MKLIRTLIETKLTADSAQVRPSELTQKPQSQMERFATNPVIRPKQIISSRASERARSEQVTSEPAPAEPLDPRLEEYKSDLADLTPRRAPVSTRPKRKKVWDLDAEKLATLRDDVPTVPVSESEPKRKSAVARDVDVSEAKAEPETAPTRSEPANLFEVPNPLAPRRNVRVARVRTRIMGFGANASANDMFDVASDDASGSLDFPVGWLVVTQGPGRGKSFTLQNVVSTIGRGLDQTITLNFGDDTISRSNHAAVAFDDQMNACFLGYGGKANLVRLNGRPVLTTEQLAHGDLIRIGETDLRYVALCGPDFVWGDDLAKDDPKSHG